MIPRTLIPRDVRPARPDAPAPRRLTTALDERTLVPSGIATGPLQTRTAIPAHLPLEVLGSRTVVPRDMPATPLQARSEIPQHVPLTILDSRVAVPKDLPIVAIEPKLPVSEAQLPDVLEPDVLTTGEVHLLVKPVEERPTDWSWLARAASVGYHAGVILLLLFWSDLFPQRTPTREQMEIARRQLSFIYLPPEVTEVPRLPPSAAEPTSPQMRIDPRVLRQVAPPSEELQPTPGRPEPERVQRDLPNAPTPQLPVAPEPPRGEPKRETARLEAPDESASSSRLMLPRTSPGKALEESLRDAMRGRGTGNSGTFGGPAPGGPGAPGGGGQSYLGGNVQMLTPDEGVDFTNYLARVLASVKRNWYAVIPESARLGDRGRVVLQFRILRDGNVPFPEPQLMFSSGKEPLDRAALSAIRASSPFEPLPPAFSGPFIELRFIFLYNLPLSAQ